MLEETKRQDCVLQNSIINTYIKPIKDEGENGVEVSSSFLSDIQNPFFTSKFLTRIVSSPILHFLRDKMFLQDNSLSFSLLPSSHFLFISPALIFLFWILTLEDIHISNGDYENLLDLCGLLL
jgi:hypothetical protein